MKKRISNILIEVLFFIAILTIILGLVLKNQIYSLDEIWNYNYAHENVRGLMPYKDFNIIITPLFPYIVAMFLKIFGDQLIVFRIFGALLISSIFFITYKILNQIQGKKLYSIIVVLTMMILYKDLIAFDYNFFSLFFVLIIISIELSQIKNDENKSNNIVCKINKKERSISKENINSNKDENVTENNKKENLKNTKIDIIIGIITGLVICTKQTIGLFTTIVILIEPFILSLKHNKIEALKKSMFRLLGIIGIGLLFILYLLLTNSFGDFINYAILGIKTFNNHIGYNNVLFSKSFYIRLIAIIAPIYLIISIVMLSILKVKLNKNEQNIVKYKSVILKMICLTTMEFAMIITIYPITDRQHFLIGIYILIVQFFGIIGCLLNNKKIGKGLLIIELVILSLLSFCWIKTTIYNCKTYINSYKITEIKYYRYIPSSSEDEKLIKDIGNFILEKEQDGYDVKIIDSMAALFKIPIDKYDKNYDLPLIGNIGKDGEDGLINEMESRHNTLYLVLNDKYTQNWQALKKVIKHIKENYEKQGKVYYYIVYLKK